MASLNKVLLIGNLTRDPELRYTSGGAAICGFGLAMNRRYTTAGGEQREETCFVDIDVWGKQAESCNNYLRKGSPAFVEGRLRLDSWQDRETGKPRSRLTVTAERVQFLGSPRGEFNGPGQGQAPRGQGQGYGGGGGRGYAPSGGNAAPAPQQGYAQPAGPANFGGNSQVAPPQAQNPPPQQQMPAFEQPDNGDDTLDDIPF